MKREAQRVVGFDFTGPLASLVQLYWTIIEGDKGDNVVGPHPLGQADVSETFS